MKSLEIILKVAERCNINCTYCYFFNGSDQSYKLHSKHITIDTVEKVAKFLHQGCKDLMIKRIQIDFHGGEPLILDKNLFISICEIFKRVLSPLVELEFCLQTNAMLIDNEWIEIFSSFDIKVSTSLDGNEEMNDKSRVHFNGKGTYEEVVNGIAYLQRAQQNGKLNSHGVICVINPQEAADIIYNHFINDLNFELLEFLLPDQTHDTFNRDNIGKYAHYLITLFDKWFSEDNPQIKIRLLNSVISLMLGGKSYVSGFGTENTTAITISSNGDLGPDDILRSSGNIINTGFTVHNMDLKGFCNYINLLVEEEINVKLSSECKACCWYKVCGATHPVHRYSEATGYSNKSIYCSDLKIFYTHVATTLLKRGLPLGDLIRNLNIENA